MKEKEEYKVFFISNHEYNVKIGNFRLFYSAPWIAIEKVIISYK